MYLAHEREKEIIPLLLEKDAWLPKHAGVSLCMVPCVYIEYGNESHDKWLNDLLTRVKKIDRV